MTTQNMNTSEPKSVAQVRTLTRIGAAIGLIAGVMNFIVNKDAGGNAVWGLIGSILGAALWIWLGIKVVQHTEWARMTLGVLAIIGAVLNVIAALGIFGMMALAMAHGMSQGMIIFSGVLSIIDVVLDIMIAVACFNAATKTWCAPTQQPTTV